MLEYFLWKKYKSSSIESYQNSGDPAELSNMIFSHMNGWTILLSFIIAIYSAYLAYNCTRSSPSTIFRYLSVIIAFLLNSLYLMYYFIRYVILRDNC